ncbi:hypothetical protein CEXT_512851 [Caerostris extrusa]|uniref:Uncharacterized protein n=1 Tax=Caerostris extrusa TaxID=172846 RepID=A0AAV4XF12_CAEEX|nr:hypothetical protein CEXT_512851 [Caerostris extrusa]
MHQSFFPLVIHILPWIPKWDVSGRKPFIRIKTLLPVFQNVSHHFNDLKEEKKRKCPSSADGRHKPSSKSAFINGALNKVHFPDIFSVMGSWLTTRHHAGNNRDYGYCRRAFMAL